MPLKMFIEIYLKIGQDLCTKFGVTKLFKK